MSASSQPSSSTSPTNTQQSGCVVDPLDLLDFSEYDGLPYQSPSVSPSTTTKPQFARPPTTSATPITMPQQTLTGPSHQYDQYKQQTPFVPGALASTMALNETNMTGYSLDYMTSMSPNNDFFDFNSAPSQAQDMDMDFESPADTSFYFPASTVNPNAIAGRDSQTLPSPPPVTSNVGRMYPGMHQQAAALAKAQAQQRQQQQIIQQQQQQRQNPQIKQQRAKSAQPSDPIVEQKITQLLNSMRAKTGVEDDQSSSPLLNIPRPRKEEDEMDEDERLLASEEGKKLSSKERRQLRNKVSARAFRSRRKEYITQLESEIANKVTENGDLRAQNRALIDENRRLSDLTRMLLSSPSFSNFLDHLSTNPAPAPPQQQPAPQVEQRQQDPRQLPKDVNPYAAAQVQQRQQIGMVMIPEQSIDFSMLNLESNDTYSYQPQVYTVETPEAPVFDASILSGKSTVTESFDSDSAKVEMPIFEAPARLEAAKAQAPETPAAVSEPVEETVANLDADIFDDDAVASPRSDESGAIFAAQSEKAYTRIDLVDAPSSALMRVKRICANLEDAMARLERLTGDL